MSMDDVNMIVERVRRVMKEAGLSQAQAAKEAGVSQARLNQWLSGKYEGDNQAMDREMERWLARRESQPEASAKLRAAPWYYETATSRRVLATLAYAQMAGDMGIVYGGAGVGKTRSAERYQRENPNVWIATMNPATKSVATCLDVVVQAVGIQEAPQGANRMVGAILSRVRDTGGLLVIDEAQHVGMDALEALRSIHDAAGVGMAIMGNERVYAQLTGGSRQAHFAQLFSRLGKRLQINLPQAEDVDALIAAWSLDEACRDACHGIAKEPGALRWLTKVLGWASMFAAGAGEQLGPEHIKAAWRDLGGV